MGNASVEVHYPWGNSFDKTKSNLWASGKRKTVPVTEYSDGDTANGVRQLIGNVWEWANTQYAVSPVGTVEFYANEPMAEIRGARLTPTFTRKRLVSSEAVSRFLAVDPTLVFVAGEDSRIWRQNLAVLAQKNGGEDS